MESNVPRSLLQRLAEEIQHAGSTAKLIPDNVAEDISNSLLTENHDKVKVYLKAPRKISATLSSDLATLDWGVCSGSRDLEELTPIKVAQPYCRDGSYIIPAPVWVVTITAPRIQTIFTSQPNFKIIKGMSDVINSISKLRKMKVVMLDRSRPISTLKFQIEGNIEDPKPVITQSAVMSHVITLTPSESITKPITISAFSYDKDCIEIETADELKGIKKLMFCKNLKIIQATIGYRAGHPKAGNKRRVMVFDASFEGSKEIFNIYVRYLETPGIVGKINDDHVRQAIQALSPSSTEDGINKKMWTALHTISHAFLVNLPSTTGLNSQDFAEALSIVHREFAVYDNSPGGLGGVEGVVNPRVRMLDPNFELKLRAAHHCPLNCTRACKACLYTDSCYMLNWNLDRRILVKLGWGE